MQELSPSLSKSRHDVEMFWPQSGWVGQQGRAPGPALPQLSSFTRQELKLMQSIDSHKQAWWVHHLQTARVCDLKLESLTENGIWVTERFVLIHRCELTWNNLNQSLFWAGTGLILNYMMLLRQEKNNTPSFRFLPCTGTWDSPALL